MNTHRCPRCLQDEKLYQAPPGKVVRNPYASGGAGPQNPARVLDPCPACDGSGYIPPKVADAIVSYARTPERAEEYLQALRWSGDHFSFNAHGMYIGVESDGYLHS